MNQTRRDQTKAFFSSPQFHAGMSVVWACLIIPTLILWPNSVLWVATMSLYANFIGHWSAYQAARAERIQQCDREHVE